MTAPAVNLGASVALEVAVAPASPLPDGLNTLGLPCRAGESGPEYAVDVPAGVAAPEPLVAEWCRAQGFAARPGEVLVLRSSDGPTVVLVGLGPGRGLDAERWRQGAAALVRSAGGPGPAALVVPAGPVGTPADSGEAPAGAELAGAELAGAVSEGAVLAAYRFDRFRSEPPPAGTRQLVLLAAGDDGQRARLTAGVARGASVAGAVWVARDLVNTPPSDLPPSRFAELVEPWLAARPQVRVEVWDERRIAEERLGGLLGVSRGSAQPPRLVRAEYRPQEGADGVPHIVLVGKGITFDSGGLSLKTPEGMVTMKTDMTGAAVMLATLAACADLDLRVRLTAITPLAENMPGDAAIKPGDVLVIRNGATIEVLNTDAEGRLVLADGLVLAGELAPDAIIDAATLTGAAVAALGRSIGALLGNDDALVEELRRCGQRAGEALWPLPLATEAYGDHIDSEVADMKNTGKPGQAGAISAALLLARFVGDVPWAHLDIAGPARSTESQGYLTKGGTGFGVRTLVELLASHRGGWGDPTPPGPDGR